MRQDDRQSALLQAELIFSVERTWRNICPARNVSDFKTVTSYRLIGKDQYEQVAPGGELKHGTLGEEAYANNRMTDKRPQTIQFFFPQRTPPERSTYRATPVSAAGCLNGLKPV